MEFSKIHFKKVEIPRYIEEKIQLCALKHLDLEDMGKLRDKYDAQAYFDKLRIDILSEFAFEKFLDLGEFDWTSRAEKKRKRLEYCFSGQIVNLYPFSKERKPVLQENISGHLVLIYLKPERKVYIGGLLLNSEFENYINMTENISILGNDFNIDLKSILNFDSKNELLNLLDNVKS